LAGLTAPSAAEQLADDADPDVAAALADGDVERALELLLARVADADSDERDRIREQMVALFGDLGPEHPTTVAYRRRPATAPYQNPRVTSRARWPRRRAPQRCRRPIWSVRPGGTVSVTAAARPLPRLTAVTPTAARAPLPSSTTSPAARAARRPRRRRRTRT